MESDNIPCQTRRKLPYIHAFRSNGVLYWIALRSKMLALIKGRTMQSFRFLFTVKIRPTRLIGDMKNRLIKTDLPEGSRKNFKFDLPDNNTG